MRKKLLGILEIFSAVSLIIFAILLMFFTEKVTLEVIKVTGFLVLVQGSLEITEVIINKIKCNEECNKTTCNHTKK